jgi:hypothetical protein
MGGQINQEPQEKPRSSMGGQINPEQVYQV